MNIYVQDGKVLTEEPEKGSYIGKVTLPICEAELLQFFSNCLGYYAYFHQMLAEDKFVEQAIDVIVTLECLAEKSGVSHIFKSYLEQEREIRNGKES